MLDRLVADIDLQADTSGLAAAIRAATSGITADVDVEPDTAGTAARIRAAIAGIRERVSVDVDIDTGRATAALSGLLGSTTQAGVGLTRLGLAATAAQAAVSAGVTTIGGLASVVASASGALLLLPAAIGAVKFGMAALKLATEGVSGAFSAALTGDAAAFAASLEELSPAAREAAIAVRGLQPAVEQLRSSLQDRLFGGLAPQITAIGNTYLPILEASMGRVASAANVAARDVASMLRESARVRDVTTLTGNFATAWENVLPALRPVAAALLDIGLVGSTFLPQLTDGIGAAATRFAEFIAEARETGQLQQIIQGGIDTLSQLGDILGNLGEAVAGVFSAANVAGGGLLTTLERLTGELTVAINSAAGQEALTQFFAGAQAAVSALLPVIGGVVQALGVIGPVLQQIGLAAAPVIQGLVDALVVGLRAAAPGITAFAQGFLAVVSALTPLLPLIGQLAGIVGGVLGAAFQAVAPAIAAVVNTLVAALQPVLPVIAAALQQVAVAVGPLAQAFAGVLGAAVQALAPILAQVATILSGVLVAAFQALTPVIQQLAPIIGQVVAILGQALLEALTALAPLMPPLISAFLSLVTAVLPLIPPLLQIATSVIPLVVAALQAIIPIITSVVTAAAGLVSGIVSIAAPILSTIALVLGGFSNLLAGIITAVGAIVGAVVSNFAGMISNVSGAVGSFVGGILGFFGNLLGGVVNAVGTLVGGVIASFGRMAGAVLSSVGGFINGVLGFFLRLPGQATQALAGWAGQMVGVGRNVIAGIVNGLASAAGQVINFLTGLAQRALNSVLSFFGIRSPSRVFAQVGRDLGLGLAQGVDRITPTVEAATERMSKAAVGAVDVSGAVDAANAVIERLDPTQITGGDGSSLGDFIGRAVQAQIGDITVRGQVAATDSLTPRAVPVREEPVPTAEDIGRAVAAALERAGITGGDFVLNQRIAPEVVRTADQAAQDLRTMSALGAFPR